MTPDNTKWMRISQEVMHVGCSPYVRDGPACKTKWNQLIPDYKRIADYLNKIGRSIPDYWELSSNERRAEGLPTQFSQEVFEAINEWYGNRPQIQPPHVRDLFAPTDNNYIGHDNQTSEGEEDPSEPDIEDPMDFPVHHTVEGAADVTPPRSPQMASSMPSRGPIPSKFTTTLDSRPRPGLPPGITPQVISSSDTSTFSLKRRPGNTGVHRKSISGHTLVADAN